MSRRLCVSLASLALFSGFLASVSLAADDDHSLGRDLFIRKWTTHDKLSETGDGLGPMHNAASCAACHELAGPGGAGGRQHNVDLLSVLPVKTTDLLVRRGKFDEALIEVHPSFDATCGRVKPSFVLHRFGAGRDYDVLRSTVLGTNESYPDHYQVSRVVQRRLGQPAHIQTLVHRGIALQRTQRNTPALWGAGLIDSVPETVLKELAAEQVKNRHGVSGRLPPANEGGIGRFGWRGQTATLRHFVIAACANELGLQSKQVAQPANPLAPNQRRSGEDISPADIARLVLFVAKLPPPVVRQPRSDAERNQLRRGQGVFARIGCNDCHVHKVGTIEGLFSDLLLHDMGPMFDDPVEPNETIHPFHPESEFRYASGRDIFRPGEPHKPGVAQEWRTPPLWGVADSAPYMHDGRADTLSQAIQLHGGEATLSANHFRALSGDDRTALLVFLGSLIAPPPEVGGQAGW